MILGMVHRLASMCSAEDAAIQLLLLSLDLRSLIAKRDMCTLSPYTWMFISLNTLRKTSCAIRPR